MTNGTCAFGWIRILGVGLAASAAAHGGDFCCKAPKCWQYHRDVCFGYYQTNWRKWEEACGQPPRISGVSPAAPAMPAPAAGAAFHEARKPLSNGTVPSPVVLSAAPRSRQQAVPSAYVKSKERSTPPAVMQIPTATPVPMELKEGTKSPQ
jgi:hypothetical protein